MLVFCEECGVRFTLDMKNIKGRLHSFKCNSCGHLITISKENPRDIIPPASALLAQIQDHQPKIKSGVIRVLIVDDSKLFRRIFKQILESDGTIEVVGEASNGNEALELNETLNADLITLDVNMPIMGGSTTLKRFMLTTPCPVVIISNLSNRTQSTIIDFLRLGAVDFLLKPKNNQDPEKTRQRFIKTIQRAAGAQTNDFKRLRAPKPLPTQVKPAGHRVPCQQLAVILSGAGGYAEIFKFFSRLPSGFEGTIVVMQAMPAELTIPLVEYINQICRIPVLPLGTDTQLLAGHCYFGTCTNPLVLQKQKGGFYLKESEMPDASYLQNQHCELVLRSMADQFPGPLSLTFLSGADAGPIDSLQHFRAQNGKIAIQKPSTSMVREHLEEIKAAKLADAEVAPEEIVEVIIDHLGLPCVALSGNRHGKIGTDFTQNRRFQRIFFTMATGPRAKLIISGSPAEEIVATVMNLSEDGLGMVVTHDKALLLQNKSQEIQIKSIEGEPDLNFLAGEKAQVCWVLEAPKIPNNGFGCMFIDIPGNTRRHLNEIVVAALQEHNNKLSAV